MNRIAETFETLKREGRKALIPYIAAGDPDLETTVRLVIEMERSGADIVELGVPFSDPVADGPTIQRACLRSLQKGTTLRAIVATVASIRASSRIPIVLMTYYNPILAYGVSAFCWEAARAGVNGVIVPDLPPEEGGELIDACREQGLAVNFLVAPTSTVRRTELIDAHTTGFVYCVSLTGVTGARNRMDEGAGGFMEKVRAHATRPLAIGFGISTPEQARKAVQLADGVIVGSAIIDAMERCANSDAMVQAVGDFVAALRQGIDDVKEKSEG
ncbi:MAG: tryptophan synthase subunit alpha [candidate division Zixibacteria bacterium]|nr:tryptophan synthase subunit alpha [candidate division Zixibacteria bacterium]